MADNQQADNASQQLSEAQPGETNDNAESNHQSAPESEATKSTLYGAGLKYGDGDDVPSWAKGKTADEIVRIAEDLRRSVVNGSGVAQQGNTSQSVQQTSQQASTANANVNQNQGGNGLPQLSADDMYSNPDRFTDNLKQYVNAATQAQIAQASQGLTTPLVSMARNESMRGEYADVWNEYGPEIDSLMQNVPMQNRANPDMWNQAAEMVAGRHYRELAAKEAERVNARADSGMVPSDGRTTGAAVTSNLGPIKKMFVEDSPAIMSFKREGLTADDVIRHARDMGHTEETYAEMLKNKKNIRRYVKDGGRTTTEPVHV